MSIRTTYTNLMGFLYNLFNSVRPLVSKELNKILEDEESRKIFFERLHELKKEEKIKLQINLEKDADNTAQAK